MKKLVLLSLSAGLSLLASVNDADAQQQRVKDNMIQKSRWYTAPREYQIIDERPIVKDFREAPQAPGYVDLPPGPEGAAGGYGGGGAGAMGDPGGAASAPVQLGGPNQGFRTDSPMMGNPMALPKSGFGRESNIPARGMGPKGPLPGVTQGVLGKMMTPKPGSGAGPASGAGNVRGRLLGGAKPAQAQSYSGGYGSGSGIGNSGSSTRTDASVRGRLLNAH